MSVAPDNLLKGGRFAAEKPKKVQNVFIFWSPESTEKREKTQSKEFLEFER